MASSSSNEQQQGATATKVSAKLIDMYQGFKRPGIRDMWPQELWQRVQRNDPSLVIIDARAPEERQVSVLPGPTVSPEEYEARAAADQAATPPSQTVVCYCTAGLRSANCAVRLQRIRQQQQADPGQPPIEYCNLVGGVLGWAQEQLPLVALEDRSRETRRVHVWAAKFASAVPDAYQPVWFAPTSPTWAATMLGVLWAWVDPQAWWAALRKRLALILPLGSKDSRAKGE